METIFRNYTPHAINLYDIEGETLLKQIPKTGMIIRASRNSVVDRKVMIDGNEFEVRKVRFGEPILVNTLDNNAEVPLPPVQEGVVMIVSAIAGAALKEAGRTDFLLTDGSIRNDDGNIIGVTGFSDMSA
tara:strand:- start:4247 stop:4636 length:390 start_codon:yes stop_codon:yes gene_type:complete